MNWPVALGAVCLGLVVGWMAGETFARLKPISVSALGAVVTVMVGTAVIGLFRSFLGGDRLNGYPPEVWLYPVGLLIGVSLAVGVTRGSDLLDWIGDRRRRWRLNQYLRRIDRLTLASAPRKNYPEEWLNYSAVESFSNYEFNDAFKVPASSDGWRQLQERMREGLAHLDGLDWATDTCSQDIKVIVGPQALRLYHEAIAARRGILKEWLGRPEPASLKDRRALQTAGRRYEQLRKDLIAVNEAVWESLALSHLKPSDGALRKS